MAIKFVTWLAGLTNKATPDDADELYVRQESDNTSRSTTWANIKTALGGIFAKTGAIGASGLTVGTGKLVGRGTAGTGPLEEITLGTNLSLTGNTLNAAGGSSLTLDAGKLAGRGSADGAGPVEPITLGTNLSMTGTTLNATGGGATPGGSTGDVQYNAAGTLAGAPLKVPDANTIEQVNGANSQKYYIYKSLTAPGSFERGFVRWSGDGIFEIGPEVYTGGASTSTYRGLRLTTNQTGKSWTFVTDGVNIAGTYTTYYITYANTMIQIAAASTVRIGTGICGVYVTGLSGTARNCKMEFANDNFSCAFGIQQKISDEVANDLPIYAQTARAAAGATHIVGGSIRLSGGDGSAGAVGAANGGSITLAGGTGYGTGIKGIVVASRLRADGFATAIVRKTTDYTTALDDSTIEFDATSGPLTNTLFPCLNNAGKIIVVKKIDSSANAVTVDGNASETIDGAATTVLTAQWATVTLQVNTAGTAWNKI